MNLNPFSYFRKSHDIQEKSYNYDGFNLFNYSTSCEWGRISNWQALRYYEQVYPIATGIDKITDEYTSLQTSIFDKSTQKYITDHPLLDLLDNPNATESSKDFHKKYSAFFKVTGDVYLLATGLNPNQPPKELYAISPKYVSITMNTRDGFPENYLVNESLSNSRTFRRKEMNGKLRYFDEIGNELWHVKNFNPQQSSENFHGASELNPIYYEIEQHLKGSKHNLSFLTKGGRPTGALILDNVVEDDVFQKLKESISNTLEGPDKAGKLFLLNANGGKFHEMSKTARDMDFAKLMASKQESIFTRLNIPLPLVSGSAMTLNNYGTAQVALFDNAVLPLMNKLYTEITLFLGSRYKLKPGQILSVDQVTISALQSRRLTNLSIQNKLNILTDNEQRASIGKESIQGGDILYKPANMVPAGQDQFVNDNRDKPASRQKFIDIMKEQTKADGSKYSEAEIKNIADREGLHDT